MLKKKLLIIGTMSVLVTTTAFGVGTENCLGGVCYANLDYLKPSKGFEQQQQLMRLEQPRYIKKYFKNESIDKSMTIVLDGNTITVFPKSSYVMTEEEKIDYLAKEANKDLLRLTKSAERIENKILEKSNLPNSEYYCEKEMKALYNKESDSFQCVS